MKEERFTITRNERISSGTYQMTLSGNAGDIGRPGRFIDIEIPGFFLRRPISIYDWGSDHIDIMYKVLGNGTDAMSEMGQGEALNVLLPLGNGFDVSKAKGIPLLVAGGIGLPPIYGVAKELVSRGITPDVIVGFRDLAGMLPLKDLEKLGITPTIAIEESEPSEYDIKMAAELSDVNVVRGLVTDAIKETVKDAEERYIFCCGPLPMLNAVYNVSGDGQFSFEERMGCGFGACMGCSLKTVNGYKRICKDGPVLYKDEIVW